MRQRDHVSAGRAWQDPHPPNGRETAARPLKHLERDTLKDKKTHLHGNGVPTHHRSSRRLCWFGQKCKFEYCPFIHPETRRVSSSSAAQQRRMGVRRAGWTDECGWTFLGQSWSGRKSPRGQRSFQCAHGGRTDACGRGHGRHGVLPQGGSGQRYVDPPAGQGAAPAGAPPSRSCRLGKLSGRTVVGRGSAGCAMVGRGVQKGHKEGRSWTHSAAVGHPRMPECETSHCGLRCGGG